MPTKQRKSETTLQDVLAGLHELLGWQAELIREGLRLVRTEAEPKEHVRRSAKRSPRNGDRRRADLKRKPLPSGSRRPTGA